MNSTSLDHAEHLLDFIDHSPTPFHAVHELANRLNDAGFVKLEEPQEWNLAPEGKYYVTRNDSSLVAFQLGSEPPEQVGFKIIGAHTDSPNLRLKPNPVVEQSGYIQLGVEMYGGVLLSTWTDRDLSLAGRIIVRSGSGKPETRLIRFDRPLLRIPQLAIHLNREVNEKGLLLNRQKHLPPILALVQEPGQGKDVLSALIAQELSLDEADILGQELALFDTQKSTLAGPDREFIFAPRLDNLASCHAATTALVESGTPERATRALAFYDHEEIGSQTAQGGESPFLKDVLERICLASKNPRSALMQALAQSFFVSADMAHGVHPNYADMHDPLHLPMLNGGPVIKSNASQRYATEGISGACFELLCERAGVAVQKFAVRSDMGCGSTIGPITAANLGIRTVDVGNPMLSMHSIREMAGSRDHGALIRVFQEYFTETP